MNFRTGKGSPHSGPAPDPGRWTEARDALQQSLMAEEIAGSISSQMLLLEATRDLPGLKEAYRDNGATVHHLLTAAGCLDRMARGDWHETVLTVLIQCLYAARNCERTKRGHLERMRRAAPEGAKPAVENLLGWIDLAENHLQRAMISAQRLIGTARWNQIAPHHPM